MVSVVIGTSRSDFLQAPVSQDEETLDYYWESGTTIDGAGGNDEIWGGAGSDFIFGSKGNDLLYGARFNEFFAEWGDVYLPDIRDTINGGSGDDTIFGTDAADNLVGASGSDVIEGGGGKDTIDGGSGRDTLVLEEGLTDPSHVDLGGGVMTVNDFDGTHQSSISNFEDVIGSNGIDVIVGSRAANQLGGGAGDDSLWGAEGQDALIGGAGADRLSGGAGADRFVFSSLQDSPTIGRDRIVDFSSSQGDRIDLSAIDAQTGTAGDQSFDFIGTDAFSGEAGELRISYRSSGIAVATVDVDGDGQEDLNIRLNGVTVEQRIGDGDFIL